MHRVRQCTLSTSIGGDDEDLDDFVLPQPRPSKSRPSKSIPTKRHIQIEEEHALSVKIPGSARASNVTDLAGGENSRHSTNPTSPKQDVKASSHVKSNASPVKVTLKELSMEFTPKADSITGFPCPICFKSFAASVIETHANVCLTQSSEVTASSARKLNSQFQPGDHFVYTVEDEEEMGEVDVIVVPDVVSHELPHKKSSVEEAKSAWASIFAGSKAKANASPISRRKDAERTSKETSTFSKYGILEKPRLRSCPWYKIMPEIGVAVDAFMYGAVPNVRAYFLSHFHSDHYGGLTKKWNAGLIYCSCITANLVERQLGIDPKWIRRLPMDTPFILPAEKLNDSTFPAVTVNLIDANHCPGAVLFLFEFKGAKKTMVYLHTGDFRATESMVQHPLLLNHSPSELRSVLFPQKIIDILYLDTTYLNPVYTFPPQAEVIDAVCAVAERMVKFDEQLDVAISSYPYSKTSPQKEKSPKSILQWLLPSGAKGQKCRRVLFVVGAYSIGKERVFTALAKRIGSKVFVEYNRKRMLECQENPEIMQMLTRKAEEASIHVVPMSHLNKAKLQEVMTKRSSHFDFILAIKPTGWTFNSKAASFSNSKVDSSNSSFTPQSLTPKYLTPLIAMIGLPYSEHSSFSELAAFVQGLRCRRVIPTVMGGGRGESGIAAMNEWIKLWCSGGP